MFDFLPFVSHAVEKFFMCFGGPLIRLQIFAFSSHPHLSLLPSFITHIPYTQQHTVHGRHAAHKARDRRVAAARLYAREVRRRHQKRYNSGWCRLNYFFFFARSGICCGEISLLLAEFFYIMWCDAFNFLFYSSKQTIRRRQVPGHFGLPADHRRSALVS